MRKLSLLLVVVLLGGLLLVPAQAQEEEVPPVSTGCTVTSEVTLTRSGTGIIEYGPEDFIAGEEITFLLTADDPDASYSVYANDALIASLIGVGSGVIFPIPADGSYTFLIPIESSGSVTVTYTMSVDCETTVEAEDPFNDGPPYPICHYPPGNPGNAHSITVGSMGAVDAHLGHGDIPGPCAEDVESRFDGGDGQVVIFIGDDAGEIYGICDAEGCQLIALIDIELLISLEGSQEETEFDEDPDDDWNVIVYFLGMQDRDGDGEEVEVYQINIYVAGTLIDDNVLILIDDDDSFVWETNGDTTPDDGDDD